MTEAMMIDETLADSQSWIVSISLSVLSPNKTSLYLLINAIPKPKTQIDTTNNNKAKAWNNKSSVPAELAKPKSI